MMKVLAEYIANDDTLLGDYESIGQLIKRYVKNNLARKLTLNEIARNLHCSTVTLTEHFKREFGITINEYITKKRMSLAEKLLLSTDKPLREVAALCGFPDVEYFSRTFKKFHDISPASWRREKGEKPNDNT
jgi:AraC-like DNA-binding protein